jgi:hypothetical protein
MSSTPTVTASNFPPNSTTADTSIWVESTNSTTATSPISAVNTIVSTATSCQSIVASENSSSTVIRYCDAVVSFGDGHMPSMMLVPAYTLVWVPFVFEASGAAVPNSFFVAEVGMFGYADDAGMNITLGLYGPDGNLIDSDVNGLPSDYCEGQLCVHMGDSPSGSPNQIMSNESHVAMVSWPISQINCTLQQGGDFYVAFVVSHPVWIGGFSASDRSGGSGPEFGQSPWESPVTYEGQEGQQDLSLPTSLPQAQLTSPFEIAIVGELDVPAA